MNIRLIPGHFMIATALLLFTMLASVAMPSKANEAPRVTGDNRRPKICLVLSGGGARGAAHVGVIKVLEENRVPIDCIVGTSMGALVGAAYSSGTSIADMEKTDQGAFHECLVHRHITPCRAIYATQAGGPNPSF